ncbi:hypothetical protein MIR68_001316 [Amoeboaphelidium protococcarum]|nr:hypothetical protein MIR68_001316 [Amoeboaphelidium protococcarum]
MLSLLRSKLVTRQVPLARLSALQKRTMVTGDGQEDHHELTYEEYTETYIKFFKNEADDIFELQRGLNQAFSVDLVPAPSVLVEALKAARRMNSFVLAVRTLEGLRDKIGDEKIYKEYLNDLKPTLDELGVPAPEELGR